MLSKVDKQTGSNILAQSRKDGKEKFNESLKALHHKALTGYYMPLNMTPLK